jgi:hypothetical protein
MATSSSLYAIVIGISQYDNPAYNLQFAKADALSFYNFLTSHNDDERGLGVPGKNIRTLYDRQATYKNIINTIEEHFICNTSIRHGDPMLFYYSGHGARYMIENRDEWPTDDGFFEAIAPADRKDSDQEEQGDIPDATLRGLFKQVIEAKGNNLTLIIDCCHSGSIHRGLDDGADEEDGKDDGLGSIVRSRNVEPLRSSVVRKKMEREAVAWYKRPSSGERSLNDQGRGWAPIVLAACRQDQKSWEAKRLQGGLFTRCLMDALASLDLARLTYETLIGHMNSSCNRHLSEINTWIAKRNAELDVKNAEIRAENAQLGREGKPKRVKRKTPFIEQTFQLEGWHKNKRVLDGKALGVSIRRVRVKPNITSNEWTLLMGAIHGVVVGTEFNITDSEFFNGQKLGVARATAVYDVWSVVDLHFQPDHSTRLWAEVAFWANEARPVRISLQETQDTNNALQAELVHALTQPRETSDNNYDLDVCLAHSSPSDCSVIAEVKQDRIILKQVDAFSRKAGAESIFEWEVKPGHSLWEMLRAVSRFNFFLAHEPAAASDKELRNFIDVKVLLLSPDEERVVESLPTQDDHTQITDDPDARYAISIDNRSDKDLWPTVFYFDTSDYSIATIYTPPEFGMSPLQAKSKLVLGFGGAGVDPFSFSIPNEERERDVGFLKIYLSGRYTNLTMIEQQTGFNHVENSDETKARGWSDPTQHSWDTKTVILDVIR